MNNESNEQHQTATTTNRFRMLYMLLSRYIDKYLSVQIFVAHRTDTEKTDAHTASQNLKRVEMNVGTLVYTFIHSCDHVYMDHGLVPVIS